MANFFKEYQKEVKKNKHVVIEDNEPIYNVGEVVYINPMYDENRNGKRFFVDYLGDSTILLAKTKKDALNGYGFIYSIYDLEG